MIFGTTKFICDKCGSKFTSVAAEWNACAIIAPVKCPNCGSMHTYPFGVLDALKDLYRKIWENIDKKSQNP